MNFAHNILKFFKFAQNYVNDKTFEKMNIKVEVSNSNLPLPQILVNLNFKFINVNLNFRFWDQIYPKNMNEKNFEKINIKTVIIIYQCILLSNCSQFEKIQILEPSSLKNHE